MNVTIFNEMILFSLTVILFLIVSLYRKLLKEQKQLNNILQDEIKKIKESTEAKNEMLVRVSHDMRTPISNMIMMLDVTKNSVNDREKLLKYIKRLENSAKYLLGLSNDILNMRKVEMGKIEIVNENINIRNVILDCFSIVEDKLKVKNIKLTRNIDKIKHVNLIGDNLRLKQVFINILVNAINHTSDNGKITFSAKETKRIVDSENKLAKVCIEFKISDNGEGMKKEFLEHIWEAYSIDNTSCFKNIGTGLGMAITKEYIDLMNGKIDVKSEIGVGSVFIINLAFDEIVKVDNKKKIVEKIA